MFALWKRIVYDSRRECVYDIFSLVRKLEFEIYKLSLRKAVA